LYLIIRDEGFVPKRIKEDAMRIDEIYPHFLLKKSKANSLALKNTLFIL